MSRAMLALVATLMLLVVPLTVSAQTDQDGQSARDANVVVRVETPDSAPMLTKPSNVAFCFIDANGDGSYSFGDPGYLTVRSSTCTATNPAGMVRLVEFQGGRPGEVVRATDPDGRGSISAPSQQPQIIYNDGNGNNAFDRGDTPYLNIRNPSSVSVDANDIRLGSFDGLPAGRAVAATDDDAGAVVRLLGPITTYIQYLDADADGAFNIGDVLYINTDGGSNENVEFSDFRLGDVGRHPFGSFIDAGDDDAVERLARFNAGPSVCVVDEDGSGSWEIGEPVILEASASCGNGVQSGNLRLTAGAGGPAGGRVAASDPEVGTRLIGVGGGSDALAFVDQDGNGKWSAQDVLYLNLVDAGGLRIAAGDVRLTFKGPERAGTVVRGSDSDAGQQLVALGDLAGSIQFVDIDSSGGFALEAPVYVNADRGANEPVEVHDVRLTTIASDLVFGTRVTSGSRDIVLELSSTNLVACGVDVNGNSAYDGQETIVAVSGGCSGDVPETAVRLTTSGGRPSGTHTRSGEADFGSRMVPLPSGTTLSYIDRNGNTVWDTGDTLYLDVIGPTSDTVSSGDVRLTPYQDLAGGRHVVSADGDAGGTTMRELGQFSSYVRHIELTGDSAFGLGDLIYLNMDNGGAETVEVGDVRLSILNAPELPPEEPEPSPTDTQTTQTQTTTTTTTTIPTQTLTNTTDSPTGQPGPTGAPTPGVGTVVSLLALLWAVFLARRMHQG